ncbi:hypothetical protein AGMMS49525_16820 [Bacteroidia bacterium]|nr:hypothetical protein AGMMS49525_16820 [Bacteroidia bacterium]
MIFAATAALTSVMVMSCGGSKSVAQVVQAAPVTKAPQLAAKKPCTVLDDAEWFTASGERRVKQNGINTAPTALQRTLQQALRLKLKGVYKGVVRDYMDQMDADEGSYVVSHIESAGDYIINQKTNETYTACQESTYPDEQGYITLYMAIKVSKKAVVDEIIESLSKDKEMEVRFKEKQFRESALKVFEQSEKEEYKKFQESQQQ